MKYELKNDPEFSHVAIMEVTVEPHDYSDEVEKQLKKYRQQYALPGFRPGHVPMTIIKKRFYSSTVLTQSTQMVEEKIFDFIKENNIQYFYYPILTGVPSVDSISPDKEPSTLTFTFKIPLIPSENLPLNDIKLPEYYHIQTTDENINEEVARWQKEFGKLITSKPVQEDSIVFIQIKVPEHLPLSSKQAYLMPLISKASAPQLIQLLMNKEKGTTETFIVKEMFSSREEAEPILRVREDDFNQLWDEQVDVTIMETYVQEPAPVDAELFNKVFPNENIETEEAFRNRILSSLNFHYQREANYHFVQTLIADILPVYPIQYSEDIYQNLYESITKKQLNLPLNDEIKNAFKKIVVEEKLTSELEVTVEDEHIKDYITRYFMLNRELEDYERKIQQIMYSLQQDNKTYKNLLDDIKYELLANKILEKYNVTSREISIKEFHEILQSQNNRS